MGRYTKLIFITAALVLVVASFTLLKRDKNRIKFDLAQNEVIIDDFEMGKVLDEQNSYYNVTARQARVNREKETAVLKDFAAHYKKDKVSVDIYAPSGFMEREFIITVKGDIKGRINEFDFNTTKNGFFHYDFLIGLATFLNGVTIKHKDGQITADKILIFSKNNYAEFIGHVQVYYNK